MDLCQASKLRSAPEAATKLSNPLEDILCAAPVSGSTPPTSMPPFGGNLHSNAATFSQDVADVSKNGPALDNFVQVWSTCSQFRPGLVEFGGIWRPTREHFLRNILRRCVRILWGKSCAAKSVADYAFVLSRRPGVARPSFWNTCCWAHHDTQPDAALASCDMPCRPTPINRPIARTTAGGPQFVRTRLV